MRIRMQDSELHWSDFVIRAQGEKQKTKNTTFGIVTQ